MSSSAAAPSAAPTLMQSTAVTPDNHGVEILVVALLCLTFSTLFFLTRLYIRWPWKSLVGLDDLLAAISFILSIIQTGIILRAKDEGLGRKENKIKGNGIETAEKLVYASNIFFVLVLAFSKAAVCALLQRFSATPSQIRFTKILAIVSGLYGVAAVLIAALQDNISEPWTQQASSSGAILARWIAICVLGSLIDLCTMAFPVFLVWNLQMARESKRKVVAGFLMRAPIVVFSVLRVVAIARLNYNDWTFSYVPTEIYTQLELHYSVAGATIPCLHVFLKGWNTRFLGTALEEIDQSAHHEYATAKGRSGGGSYPMNSVQNSKERGKKESGFHSRSLQGKQYGVSESTVQYGKGNDDAASDNSQQAIVIKRTYDVNVL